jgi:transposase
MATRARSRRRRTTRLLSVAKPSGVFHPRVAEVGPEHFGIVAVDCAKARSKWLLADFYGRILVPPTPVEHIRQGFQKATAQLQQAIGIHAIRDVIVAIERTGAYHRLPQRAFRASGFETRIVHPLTTKQFRLPADPGNKTDDTDLLAIHRAAANGFGLREPESDQVHSELQLLARYRRQLVRKNATLRNQIHAELDNVLPGLSAAVGNIFNHEPALWIARQVRSPQEIARLGINGLAALLDTAGVNYQRRSLAKLLTWAEQAPESGEVSSIHHHIFTALDDERRTRLTVISCLERDMAARLAQLPYVLLLSFPGINVVSAAELAGELGPIRNYPHEGTITGRAGLYPSRYQSDKVDRCDGPLVGRGNRALRYILLVIADNLMTCNAYFRGLWERWEAAGVDHRLMCVRAAKRFCRIAFRMVAGQHVFRHPSCQQRHAILDKLIKFHLAHESPMMELMSTLNSAVEQIPQGEHATEAIPLAAALAQASSRRRPGPRRLGEILPEVLARLGVTTVESRAKGETDLT